MNHLRHITIIGLLVIFISGCQTATPKEDTGKVVGGVLGGVLGSQVGKGKGRVAGAVAGTLLGVFIGGSIGKSMDAQDRYNTAQVLETNPTNQPTSWHNPDTNINYTVTPTNTYETAQGAPCREYTTQVNVGGKQETAYGTACRQPDGSWKIVN